MSNYRGFFRGFDRVQPDNVDGDLYCVHIGEFSAETFTEVAMAGQAPFVVNYNTSSTPFDPVRTSTATIQFINNTYMEDILPSTPKETAVYLYNETAGRMEWCGYLTPKIYDNNYTECYETVQLEAADCISVLQYTDYELDEDTNKKQIVPLAKVLGKVGNGTGLLNHYQWPTGRNYGNVPVVPDTVYVSEANFFTSDTDEPWKLSEVLEEICRYFGLTAMQFQDKLIFMDYLVYSAATSVHTRIYSKLNNWDYTGVQYLTNANTTISQSDVRDSSANISFEPVYNKCVVKDNMYAAERIIPSIFEDNMLTNRIDVNNFYASYQCTVPSPNKPTYPWGSEFLGFGQDYKKDGSGDTKYSYYHRVYDHKYWKSLYDYTDSGQPLATQEYLVDHRGGTIIDLGVVKNTYISDYGQSIVPSKLDYTRYLAIQQHNGGSMSINANYPVFRLSGYSINCPYDPENSYLVIQASAIFEKYWQRPYINPDWSHNYVKIGGNSSSVRQDGFLCMLVKIGDKYWSGRNGWTSTRTGFKVVTEKTQEDHGVYNKDVHVLNNVHYSLGIGEDGYLIPLSGTSVGDELLIDICLPGLQTEINNEYCYNGWCWIKDLDIKLVQKGQDDESNEGDVVYENIIDENAVNEIREITCKFTTSYSGVAPSYSTVLIKSGDTLTVLTGFTSPGLVEAKEAEYNIVERYVQQYSTPTKKISMSVESNGNGRRNPWTFYKGIDVENPNQIFVELGSEIDYRAGIKNFTAIQLKV